MMHEVVINGVTYVPKEVKEPEIKKPREFWIGPEYSDIKGCHKEATRWEQTGYIHVREVLPEDPDVETRTFFANIYENNISWLPSLFSHEADALINGVNAIAVAVPVEIKFKRRK